MYGHKSSGSTPVLNADESSLLTDKGEIFGRWAEHFNKILNCPSTVSDAALDEIEQLPVLEHLSMAPTVPEVQKATRRMSTGKAAGPDGIPPDVYKLEGPILIRELTSLYARVWKEEAVLQEFSDANIVHLYKRKDNRSSCDNHRGISLLATA